MAIGGASWVVLFWCGVVGGQAGTPQQSAEKPAPPPAARAWGVPATARPPAAPPPSSTEPPPAQPTPPASTEPTTTSPAASTTSPAGQTPAAPAADPAKSTQDPAAAQPGPGSQPPTAAQNVPGATTPPATPNPATAAAQPKPGAQPPAGPRKPLEPLPALLVPKPKRGPGQKTPDGKLVLGPDGKPLVGADGKPLARPAFEEDPWARPHFVKGDLSNFTVRTTPRRNFIGVAAGASALPRDTNTVINSFYLTVEPQIDVSSERFHWKLSLGAPLQFELVDLRGPFESCVTEAKALRMQGKMQSEIEAAIPTCMNDKKGQITQNLGKLRREDWDEASDFAKIIRNVQVGSQEQPFYLSLSRLYDQTFGHGTAVRHYNPNIDYDTARLGANVDFSKAAVGVQAMANDLVNPDVVGMLGFVRPMRPFSNNIVLRSLSFGGSWLRGGNQPTGLKYERGLFRKSYNQLIPEVDSNLDLQGATFHQASILGLDAEAKVVRTSWADVKVYADYDKMLKYGSGVTLGSLGRFSFGQPAHSAIRARAEVSFFGPAFLPNYFDTFHDIFQYQYLPAGYKSANGLTYYPTKLEYLNASRGGRKRVGGYAEVTGSLRDYLTLGAFVRGWTPYGEPGMPGFTGPSFADYGANCTADKNGTQTCDNKVALGREPGFASLRLHAELPFRRFLQAFASYEAFSTTAEKGLGAFKFDGDNEVFFGGARIMVLPFFFITAEGRRYFFVQRFNDVDLHELTFEQDQNFHSRWTFALNASLGYEF